MKRLIISIFLITIILTGCDKIDYKSVSIYYDAYREQINKVDSEFLPTVKQLTEELQLKDELNVFKTHILRLYDTKLKKLKKQDAKELYEKFINKLNEVTTLKQLKINVTTENLNEAIAKFKKVEYEAQILYIEYYNDVIELYDRALSGIIPLIEDTPLSQLKEEYDSLKDIVIEYMKTYGLDKEMKEYSKELEESLIAVGEAL